MLIILTPYFGRQLVTQPLITKANITICDYLVMLFTCFHLSVLYQHNHPEGRNQACFDLTLNPSVYYTVRTQQIIVNEPLHNLIITATISAGIAVTVESE